MNNQEVNSLKTRLDSLFSKVEAFDGTPKRDQSFVNEMARYLCVRVAGFIETSVHLILNEYAHETAKRAGNKIDNARLRDYITKRIKDSRNLSLGDIISLVSSFDSAWGKEIDERAKNIQVLKRADIKQDISNMIEARNSIAHGGDRSVSFVTAKTYYEIAKALVEIVDDVCRVK